MTELDGLIARLTDAGWQHVSGYTYQHPDGVTIHLDEVKRYGGYHKPMVFWRWLVERGEMPATSAPEF